MLYKQRRVLSPQDSYELFREYLALDPEKCKLFLDGPFGKALVEMIKNNLPIGEVNNNA